MIDQITAADIRALLFAACEQAGGIRKFAMQRGISPSLISAALNGDRDISSTVAIAVGYMPVTRFEPIKRPASVRP